MSISSFNEQIMSFLMVSLVVTQSATAGAEAGDGRGVRGERFIDRTVAPWMSQQVQEPGILENPQDPSRLVMFDSGVPASDRNACSVDGNWDMWCFECDRRIPTRSGLDGLYIPGGG